VILLLTVTGLSRDQSVSFCVSDWAIYPTVYYKGPHETWPVPLGEILIFPSSAGQEVSFRQDIDISSMSQGKDIWGKLRDRSVMHDHVSGTVEVHGSTISLQDWTVLGQPCKFSYDKSGTLAKLISATTHWGEDVSTGSSFSWESVWAGDEHGFAISSDLYVEQSVVFSGRVGFYQQIFYLQSVRHTLCGDKWTIPSTSTGFFIFWDEENQNMSRSQILNGTQANGFEFDFVYEGNTYRSGHLSGQMSQLQEHGPGQDLPLFRPAQTGGTADVISSCRFIASEAKKRALSHLARHVALLDYDPIAEESEMLPDILRQWNVVDRNILLAVIDIHELPKMLKSWVSLSKLLLSIKSWKKKPKYKNSSTDTLGKLKGLTSDAPLSWIYGVLPSMGDIRAVIAGWSEKSLLFKDPQRIHTRRRSTRSVPISQVKINVTSTLTVICDHFTTDVSGVMMKFISTMKRLGVYPQLACLWDLVPFSFVADWFAGFGDYISQADEEMDLWYVPYQYRIFSSKFEYDLDAQLLFPEIPDLAGNISLTRYDRSVAKDLVHRPKTDWVKFSATEFRWLEGSMLAVQQVNRWRH